MRLARGHVFIELWISIALLAVGVIFAWNGLTHNTLLPLAAGVAGVEMVLLLTLGVVVQGINTPLVRRAVERFPFGIFVAAGVAAAELVAVTGHYAASKTVVLVSPVAGIAAGILAGALAARTGDRLEALDERLAGLAEALLLLLLPLYLVGAVALSVFAELFSGGISQGIESTLGLILFLALLAGFIMGVRWTMQRYQNLRGALVWLARFLGFCLFVASPVLLLSVLFYTGLGGQADGLNVLLAIEAAALVALFGLWAVIKRRAEIANASH
ncbi:MAG: hypothetical protein ACLGGU_02130 [Gammaproteobacteria bacterium]